MVNVRVIFRHTAVWLIFISYELACLKFTVGLHGTFVSYGAYYVLYILLFYVNAHLVLNAAFFKTRHPYLFAMLFILLEMAVFGGFKVGVDYALKLDKVGFNAHSFLTQSYILSNIFREIFFIGFSIAYWSTRYMIKFRERTHLMEKEQLKTMTKNLELQNKYISVENAYLQNQISPHLLFNSLNFIYATVHLLSEQAGKGVMRLARLMRYSLVGADEARTVLLSEEVAQLENLVELCRMRFGDTFYLKFRKKGRLGGIRIIPLLLITLVENIMKHGDLGEKRYPAQISLEVRENQLLFETTNKKRNTGLYQKGGLGLKNIEKRLMNYYHKRCTLQIRDVEGFYKVSLTIRDL